MADKVCNGYCGTVGDMGDLLGMLDMGENWWDRGQTWGRSGSWGLRVGSWTHFWIGHLGESGSLRRQVLEILVCLGLGIRRLWVFDWEMEKWFHSRIGDGGFGFVDRRVGFWI